MGWLGLTQGGGNFKIMGWFFCLFFFPKDLRRKPLLSSKNITDCLPLSLSLFLSCRLYLLIFPMRLWAEDQEGMGGEGKKKFCQINPRPCWFQRAEENFHICQTVAMIIKMQQKCCNIFFFLLLSFNLNLMTAAAGLLQILYYSIVKTGRKSLHWFSAVFQSSTELGLFSQDQGYSTATAFFPSSFLSFFLSPSQPHFLYLSSACKFFRICRLCLFVGFGCVCSDRLPVDGAPARTAA